MADGAEGTAASGLPLGPIPSSLLTATARTAANAVLAAGGFGGGSSSAATASSAAHAAAAAAAANHLEADLKRELVERVLHTAGAAAVASVQRTLQHAAAAAGVSATAAPALTAGAATSSSAAAAAARYTNPFGPPPGATGGGGVTLPVAKAVNGTATAAAAAGGGGGGTSASASASPMARLTELITNTEQSNKLKQSEVVSALAKNLKKVEREKQKLQFISAELAKLDTSLSKNIDILRTEIENVNRDVSAAQSDFDRKEREYMAARTLLAKRKERKLLLTSHLEFILLTNERNKAAKLAELEQHLQLQEQDEAAAAVATAGGTAAAGGGGAAANGTAARAATAKAESPAKAPAFAGFSSDEVQNFTV